MIQTEWENYVWGEDCMPEYTWPGQNQLVCRNFLRLPPVRVTSASHPLKTESVIQLYFIALYTLLRVFADVTTRDPLKNLVS